MDEDEIRRIYVNMQVDTGSYLMGINENIQSILNLSFIERRIMYLANEKGEEYDIVGPIEVRYAGRRSVCNAFVMRGDTRPLLGAIPMEDMGIIIDPQRQEVHVIDEPFHRVGGINQFKR